MDASKGRRSRSKLQENLSMCLNLIQSRFLFQHDWRFVASPLQQSRSDFSESPRNYRGNSNSISLRATRSLKIFVILPLSKIRGL